MAIRATTPPLLSIPLELREQIFKEVLSNSSQGTELLRTCHEIKAEAQKYIFQRHITFRGQTALYTWLQQAPTQYLHYVMEITIELEEPDLGPLLAPIMTGSSAIVAPRLMTVELHERDLKRLRRSLKKLPNVKVLIVRTLLDCRSHFYRKLVADFLNILGSQWPCLQELTLEGNFHNQPLSFLVALRGLRSLSFDGFSASSPMELAAIFAQLECLNSLTLVSGRSHHLPTHQLHNGLTSERQLFTGEVLRSIAQLSSFSVTERIQPTSSPALLFTPEILEALHSHEALSSLTFRISQAPNNETLESLGYLLDHTTIERLELDWPCLDPSVFEEHNLMPESLKEFWVRVPSPEVAFEMLFIILDSREGGGMAELQKVVLIREVWSVPETDGSQADVDIEEDIDEGYDDETDAGNYNDNDNDPNPDATDEDNVARTMRLLYNYGVKVLWCTER